MSIFLNLLKFIRDQFSLYNMYIILYYIEIQKQLLYIKEYQYFTVYYKYFSMQAIYYLIVFFIIIDFATYRMYTLHKYNKL